VSVSCKEARRWRIVRVSSQKTFSRYLQKFLLRVLERPFFVICAMSEPMPTCRACMSLLALVRIKDGRRASDRLSFRSREQCGTRPSEYSSIYLDYGRRFNQEKPTRSARKPKHLFHCYYAIRPLDVALRVNIDVSFIAAAHLCTSMRGWGRSGGCWRRSTTPTNLGNGHFCDRGRRRVALLQTWTAT